LAHHHSGRHHHHAAARFGRAFAIAILLNLALVAVEVGYGLRGNSIALIADGGHNSGDVLALILAWGAQKLTEWPPTKRYTYGFGSASILSALLNSIFLLVATGAIGLEAILRLWQPAPVAAAPIIIVAGVGIVVNGVSAWLLHVAHGEDLNVRTAHVHLLADAAISLGVVIAGAIIVFTGWNRVDAAASLVIAATILWSTWSLLNEATRLSMQAVPRGIDALHVRAYLEALPGVTGVHDLHIWATSTTQTALTAHLVRPHASPDDDFLIVAADGLTHQFGIHHATLQIETGDSECRLAPDYVV
jgi:cobalt-zinc-cadmium efflux system protein